VTARGVPGSAEMQAGPYKQMRTDVNGLGVSRPAAHALPASLDMKSIGCRAAPQKDARQALQGECICSEAITGPGRERTLSPHLLRPAPHSPWPPGPRPRTIHASSGLADDGSDASQPREPVSSTRVPSTLAARLATASWASAPQLAAVYADSASSPSPRKISAVFMSESMLLYASNSQISYTTLFAQTVCYMEGGFCAFPALYILGKSIDRLSIIACRLGRMLIATAWRGCT